MSSEARTLIASRTLASGETFTIVRAGFARRSSATVFMFHPAGLHVRVVRAAAAFGNDPLDVLLRVLDVAGLAVNAVLRVDLQPRRPAVTHEFVDSSRTVTRLGAVVNRKVERHGNCGIAQPQVRR